MVSTKLDVTDKMIRARQIEPDKFLKDSFRTIRMTSGIKAVVGKRSEDGPTEIQSVLFNKDKFTEEEAKQWLRKNESRFSDAVDLEYKKDALFMESSFEQHMVGHLPSLNDEQIARLMAVANGEEISSMDEEDIKYSQYIRVGNE